VNCFLGNVSHRRLNFRNRRQEQTEKDKSMVKIRLKRIGAKNNPVYRVVVADSRKPRDGRFVEILGSYYPSAEGSAKFRLDLSRADYWLGTGAQPTDTAKSILNKAKKAAAADETSSAAPATEASE
jgi:small subunit ribosomal protein S16